MGLIVPTYTVPSTGETILNAYVSLRFENINIIYNSNGQYNVYTCARVFKSSTDVFTQDARQFGLALTKEQLAQPIHTTLYTYMKTLFPGATDDI